jgi:hypothetical protein
LKQQVFEAMHQKTFLERARGDLEGRLRDAEAGRKRAEEESEWLREAARRAELEAERKAVER